MRHAPRAGPARRRSSASRVASFKPRAGVLTRGRTRSRRPTHRGARSFVRFLRGGALPPAPRPRGRRFIVSRSFPSHSPLVHRRRPRTAKETRRRRWNPSRSSPMRRRSPSRSSTPRYWRRRRSQGTEEEGGGCQPADGARPGASPFRPIPPRVGRGHVAGAGAHPVSVPTTPRATFATSPAPLAPPRRPRDDARDRSRARRRR